MHPDLNFNLMYLHAPSFKKVFSIIINYLTYDLCKWLREREREREICLGGFSVFIEVNNLCVL